MRFLFTLAAIELGIFLGVYTADVLAQQHEVKIEGVLFQAPDHECGFFIDPTGDSEGIQLIEVLDGNYLCDYLKGSSSRPFILRMGPRD